MSRGWGKRPHGEMRRSHLVNTFGPGAMVDLPKHSVLIGGLDDWFWEGDGRVLAEERLASKVAWLLGRKHVDLRLPPPAPEHEGAAQTGVRVWQFPEWSVTVPLKSPVGGSGRWRRLVKLRGLEKNLQFLDPSTRKKVDVVPIRFVQACVRGHIDDIDWRGFVHSGSASCQGDLWLEERGTSGDLSDTHVYCEACRATRPLVSLTFAGALEPREAGASTPLGFCRGRQPWLGPNSREKCGGDDAKAQPNRLLIRSASNAYFAQTLSVISIPDRESELRNAVASVYNSHLLAVDNLDNVRYERKKPTVHDALEGFSDDDVLAEILRVRAGVAERGRPIKDAEIETLMTSQDSVGEDKPDGDFFARRWKVRNADQGALKHVDRVVLVHRLREVVAQVGFTRFEPVSPNIDGELELEVQRAPLAQDMSWVPAIENRGEGILIAFRGDAIQEWAERSAVRARQSELEGGYQAWLHLREGDDDRKPELPGIAYTMLHSLAHLLITTVALECGYAASSVRERIYCGDSSYGILLYTGASDSEGTLGGLVEVGKRMDRILRGALELSRLCSNDPICAQHDPKDMHEERFLHGAACHGCLLIAETSCEQHNQHLDRALVVPTVEGLRAEFFLDEDMT